MRKIEWPNNKSFAFTIVDDTDGATLENIKPVYDYLLLKKIITTKTVWVFPTKDSIWSGSSFEDKDYLSYIKYLASNNFEIAFHNAGSGNFEREETLLALELFKKEFGEYPTMHINHGNNAENLYWGSERLSGLAKFLYNKKGNLVSSEGAKPGSKYFWGDFAKKNIKYIRNRTFNSLNTLKCDKRLVYREKGKMEYSNYWFSSSDGFRLRSFLQLVNKKSIDKLEKQHGCAIVYTHFAYDFVDENGRLNAKFIEIIDYLSSKNGWFVPAGQLLDYVLANREYKPSLFYQKKKDLKWLFGKLKKHNN